jgi:hypothetical protein
VSLSGIPSTIGGGLGVKVHPGSKEVWPAGMLEGVVDGDFDL